MGLTIPTVNTKSLMGRIEEFPSPIRDRRYLPVMNKNDLNHTHGPLPVLQEEALASTQMLFRCVLLSVIIGSRWESCHGISIAKSMTEKFFAHLSS